MVSRSAYFKHVDFLMFLHVEEIASIFVNLFEISCFDILGYMVDGSFLFLWYIL